MKSAPKPVKQAKRKRKPLGRYGICPQCGKTFRGEPQHFTDCSGEMEPILTNKYHSEVWFLEEALDLLCRLIVFWRDGSECIIKTHECRGVVQWGHVVPQGTNVYLKHELGNSHCQCEGHNSLHRFVQTPYLQAIRAKFGITAEKMLDQARQDHPTYDWTAADMRYRLVYYNELYQNRFSHGTDTLNELVKAGYYGDIIREAFIKDGRR